MKFMLVDKIEKLVPGQEITVSKNLSLAEEYLADHFPSFPVLPGVLILQVAVEAASWLVRLTNDFSHSMLVLKGARQVRYGNFVSPGQCLHVNVKAKEIVQDASSFQAIGTTQGIRALQANLQLSHFNLIDKNPTAGEIDRRIVEHLRQQYQLIAGDLDKTD